MANTQYKFGSSEWRTHMRRSLAQRKRHGEKITDIEGLIDYIEKKGPAKERINGTNKTSSRQSQRRGGSKKQLSKPRAKSSRRKRLNNAREGSQVKAPSGTVIPNESGLFGGVKVIKS